MKSFLFEYDISAHCNLNCAYCSHYSPLAEEEYVTAEKAHRELSRMAEVVGDECTRIHIMGGEPLLNPEREEILTAARRYFPKAYIILITNGILLSKQPESFWQTCHDNDVIVGLTRYPIKLQWNLIRACACIFQVKLSIGRDGSSFTQYALDPEGGNEVEKSFAACPLHYCCSQYRGGRLYHCSLVGCVSRLNKAFDCDFRVQEADYIDLFSEVTAEDVLEFMSHSIPFCRYCNPAEWKEKSNLPWRISERLPDEWIKRQELVNV